MLHGCIVAVVLSGAAFFSFEIANWPVISLLGLALFCLLVLIDRTASAMSPHRLAWTTGWLRFADEARNLVMESRENSTDNTGLEDKSIPGNSGDGAADLGEPALTDEELFSLDQRDREMLRSIVRLDETTVREIMIPRLDMVAAEQSLGLNEVTTLIADSGHSRLPVFEETSDRIVGIVHARDVLKTLADEERTPELKGLLHPAFFIPETKRLDDLLQDFQTRGEQMAIVVDEYGGTEGLVTMEDLLEEIVGEIEDEFSRTRESEVIHQGEGSVLVDAGIHTSSIEELFGTRIEREGVDTLGGFVYQALGKIPQIGDYVTTDHLRIEVVSILGRRLRKLRISRVDEEALSQSL